MRRPLLVAVAVAAALLAAATVGARSTVGPTNLQDPTINGAAIVGRTLEGNRGAWTGVSPTYAYQWLRCKADATTDSSPSSCSPISGATKQDYTLVSSDLGKRIRLRVTATDKQGKGSATSAATSVVTTESGVPASTSAPTILGSAIVGSSLTGTTGSWVGDTPITYTYQWRRCDAAGNACSIKVGSKSTYKVVQKDAGKTLRLFVTAKNARGKADAVSNATDVVQDAGSGGQDGVITLPNGDKSIDVKDVPKGERLIVEKVSFDPNPLVSPTGPILARIKVEDTRGYVVRNAIVFIRSTPLVTSGGDNSPTATDGWVTYQLVPRQPLEFRGLALQFFVKAYRKGDPTLAGVSGTRLVQVSVPG